MSFMSPGQVLWFEIGTTTPDAVTGFYGELLGWRFEVDRDSSIESRTYTRILAPGAPWPMGAIQQGDTDDEAINISIMSADVHDDVERLTKLGATVVVPATRVADITVFARLRDPQGNLFSLFSRTTSERFEERITGTEEYMQEAVFAPQSGTMSGFEIATTDLRTTTVFYSAAFGWRFVSDKTAKGAPSFLVFCSDAPHPSGVLRDRSGEGETADYLIPYFLVDDVSAVTATAQRLGGRVEQAPTSEPGGSVRARLIDPQGNRFGILSLASGPVD